jgi:hypothetical protein
MRIEISGVTHSIKTILGSSTIAYSTPLTASRAAHNYHYHYNFFSAPDCHSKIKNVGDILLMRMSGHIMAVQNKWSVN